MKIVKIRVLRPYNYIKHSKLGVCIVHKFIQDSGLVLQPVDTANFILERSKNQILYKLSRFSKWRIKNNEKVKTNKKAYYQENKEKINENTIKYYNEHREKILAYCKEKNSNAKNIKKRKRGYYKEHSEEIKAKREKRYQDPEHAEKWKQIQKKRCAAWYEKNKEEVKKKRKQYYQENREEEIRKQLERYHKKK